MLTVVDPAGANYLAAKWRELWEGLDAALIDCIDVGPHGVALHTEIGGECLLQKLEEDPPIC